jgi:hypothetical protein
VAHIGKTGDMSSEMPDIHLYMELDEEKAWEGRFCRKGTLTVTLFVVINHLTSAKSCTKKLQFAQHVYELDTATLFWGRNNDMGLLPTGCHQRRSGHCSWNRWSLAISDDPRV